MKSCFLFILLTVSIITSAQKSYFDTHYELQVFKKDGKSGIRELYTRRIEVPAEYDFIYDLHDNLILYQGGNKGLFSLKFRKIVLPVEYEHISVHKIQSAQNPFIVLVQKNGMYGILDQNYIPLLSMEYMKIEIHSTHAMLYTNNNLCGVYFYESNKIEIPVLYDHISSCYYSSGYFVAAKNNKYFLYDDLGHLVSGDNKLITEFNHWREEKKFASDFKIIDSNQRMGIYNSNKKKYIIPCAYSNITDVYNGQYIVKNTVAKFGMVNHLNVVTLPFDYDSLEYIKPSESNTMIAYKGELCGLLNPKTMFSTAVTYDKIETINGYYRVLKDQRYSIIDSMGKSITSQTFDHVGSFYRDTCTVIQNNVIQYMSRTGQMLQGFPPDITAGGYTSINDMYIRFVAVLKSENDSLIKDFCRKIVYDDYTTNYLTRTGFSYRGIPSEMMKHHYTCDSAVNEYYKEIIRFYQKLKQLDELQCLTLNSVGPYTGYEYAKRPLDIKLIEMGASLSTSTKTYKFNLGEFLYIEGYWKVFTKPKYDSYNQ